MGNSSSKAKKRVDSFDPDAKNEDTSTTTQQMQTAQPSSPPPTGMRKASNARPIIRVENDQSCPPDIQTPPSSRGLRPRSSSSRTSQNSQRSDRYNFLVRNGIQTSDNQLGGNTNGNHQGSQSSEASRPRASSSPGQNPYVLPGTIGTTLIEGTNYISTGAADAQLTGAINAGAYSQGGSYTSSAIAHGML